MNTNKKVHSPEVAIQVATFSTILKDEFIRTKADLRTVAKSAGMSVNSVKNIIGGKTANIASYCAISQALGIPFTDLIAREKNKGTTISVDKTTENVATKPSSVAFTLNV